MLRREKSSGHAHGPVMDRMAEAQGKAHWMCKSLANVHFLPEIERCFGGEARYLYRDGRDVCLSFLRAVVGEKTAYHVARQWHAEQQLALACGRRVPASQYLALSYEELTSNSASTLELLCRWLGVDFHPAMLDFHRSEEASRTAASGRMRENVRQPVMAHNSTKWLQGMSREDAIDFESVAGRSLVELGYELEFVGKQVAARDFDGAACSALEAENQRRKAAVKQALSPEDAAARKPQEDLLAAIRTRAVAA